MLHAFVIETIRGLFRLMGIKATKFHRLRDGHATREKAIFGLRNCTGRLWSVVLPSISASWRPSVCEVQSALTESWTWMGLAIDS